MDLKSEEVDDYECWIKRNAARSCELTVVPHAKFNRLREDERDEVEEEEEEEGEAQSRTSEQRELNWKSFFKVLRKPGDNFQVSSWV